MSNEQILGALSMDLKRIAIGYHRGSVFMAQRFFQEALRRKSEIDEKSIKPYVKKILNNLGQLSSQKDTKDIAENALMYSTLLQNASISSI